MINWRQSILDIAKKQLLALSRPTMLKQVHNLLGFFKHILLITWKLAYTEWDSLQQKVKYL